MTGDAPQPTSAPMLPVIALALSVVGLCAPPVLLIALVLGAYSFLRAGRDATWAPRKQLAQMTMVVSVVGILVFVGMVLPNVKLFQLRMKQRDCVEALTQTWTAQQKFYAANARYADTQSALTFAEPPKAVVTLVFTATPEVKGVPTVTMSRTGIQGACPACSMTVLCVAQLDGDPTLDVWSVSSIERIGPKGARVPGGIPMLELDDVTE